MGFLGMLDRYPLTAAHRLESFFSRAACLKTVIRHEGGAGKMDCPIFLRMDVMVIVGSVKIELKNPKLHI